MRVLLFVDPSASLRRIEEVAREAEALGVSVTVVSPGLGVVVGRIETRELISRLELIKDVRCVVDPKPS